MLEVLKQIAPGIAQVALAFNPDSLSNPPFLRAIEAAAPSLATELTKVPVRNAAEIEPALAAIARHSGSGLMCLPDPFTVAHRDLIVGLAARYRLPAIYIQRSFVTAGGLVSYGIDVTDLVPTRGPVRRSYSQGCEARRPAGAAADQVRAGDQPGSREGARPRHPADAARPRRRGDRGSDGNVDYRYVSR
jgi:ABC transporter substrate binding protein